MMQSMKGATSLLGTMNRSMNLPALQRIAMEFEKENDIMDQRQEMMDDAIDDVTGLEDEEESEDVVKEVLDEIGVELGDAVCLAFNQRRGAMLTIIRSWEKHLPVYRVLQ
jgi:charged multivesicular body protein 2A